MRGSEREIVMAGGETASVVAIVVIATPAAVKVLQVNVPLTC